VDECKALPVSITPLGTVAPDFLNLSGLRKKSTISASQGLSLVHFSAQLERFVWDRGCA